MRPKRDRPSAATDRAHPRLARAIDHLASPASLVAFATAVLMLLLSFAQWGDPTFLPRFAPDAKSALGLMWQVHAGFLAIGFAGLTIASQVYADSPMATGVARRAILGEVRIGRILADGLVCNLLIAVGAIWLTTDAAVLLLFVLACAPTVGLIVQGYARLGSLYSDPAAVDLLIGVSLSEEVVKAVRLTDARAAEAAKLTGNFVDTGVLLETPATEFRRIDIQHLRGAVTVRNIRTETLRLAVDELNRWAPPGFIASTTQASPHPSQPESLTRPRILMMVRPYRKLRPRAVMFSIIGDDLTHIEAATIERVRALLLSAVEYEADSFVDAEERILREVNAVQDSANEALVSGAYKRAARAFELLERANEEGWAVAGPGGTQFMDTSRRDWLVMPFAELEWAVGASTPAAGLLIDSAISRSIRAANDDNFDRFVADLMSFQRLWTSALESTDVGSDRSLERLMVAVQNLAEFVVGRESSKAAYREACVWVLVNFAKEASDGARHKIAKRTVDYLIRLFRFSNAEDGSLAAVRSGQLALAGWILLRRSKGYLVDDQLLATLVGGFSRTDVLVSRDHLHESSSPASGWQWWESQGSLALDAHVVEISGYVDIAAAIAYVKGHGPVDVPPSERTASDAGRISRAITGVDPELWAALSIQSNNLGYAVSSLERLVEQWQSAENLRLAQAPVSIERVLKFREAFAAAMNGPTRLADYFEAAADESIPPGIERRVLGLNSYVPKHYFVEEVFNSTYADPSDLGSNFARAMLAGEESGVVEALYGLTDDPVETTLSSLLGLLGDLERSEDFVLIVSFAGSDSGSWWAFSRAVNEAAVRVLRVDMGDGRDFDALLVDTKNSLRVRRTAEQKTGLSPVADTHISVGVFDDAPEGDAPHARVEIGELTQTWSVDSPVVRRFRIALEEDEPPVA